MDAQSDARLAELLDEVAGIMAERHPGCAQVGIQARDGAGRLLELIDRRVTSPQASSASPASSR